MELKIILLSKISQTQKGKYCIFSLICGIEGKQYESRKEANRKEEGNWREGKKRRKQG
jgi:hypothetical protein